MTEISLDVVELTEFFPVKEDNVSHCLDEKQNANYL